MNKVIEVTDLIKKYKNSDKPAVDGISFYVKSGEFYAFLGPNGAGKTTTISILTTMLTKTSGEVVIAGYDIDKKESSIRKNIGVIFQNPSLDENLTAEENIRFHAILYGLYPFRTSFSVMPASYKKRVHELSGVLDIEDSLDQPVRKFSGGMKRKLEIVRSLMHSPKVLFLDEPTSGLDPLSRKNLWEYLGKVREEEKTTIFLTTHYLEEAEEAEHISIINNGKIVAWGTPDQLKEQLIERYMLIDAKQRGKLEKELKDKKIAFSIHPKGFMVPLNRESLAQDLVKAIDTKLSKLDIHSPTLEEAYLQIIKNGN